MDALPEIVNIFLRCVHSVQVVQVLNRLNKMNINVTHAPISSRYNVPNHDIIFLYALVQTILAEFTPRRQSHINERFVTSYILNSIDPTYCDYS